MLQVASFFQPLEISMSFGEACSKLPKMQHSRRISRVFIANEAGASAERLIELLRCSKHLARDCFQICKAAIF